MGSKTVKSGKGSRKHGRDRRKKLSRTDPLPLYVRNKISFESYLKRTGMKTPV